jgi:shikimate dehydrogenase
MNAAPDQYGVIGHPVSHSLSPFIHGLFARQTKQNLVYRLHEVPPDRFRSHVLEFFARGGRGLNVTVPHKLAAAELANELSARAERAGAVNTLTIRDEHCIVGDNTDGAGLLQDLKGNLKVPIAKRHVLIVGAGGATRGVLAPILQEKPASVVIANRTDMRARELVDDFGDLGVLSHCAFGQLPEHAFDLIINATSAALTSEVPAISGAVIGAGTICYDMTYGKEGTPFVRWALEHGCARAEQGLGMLVEQAAESFMLWRGVRPDTAAVLSALVRQRALSAS